jgi:zinc and cadmium transporter
LSFAAETLALFMATGGGIASLIAAALLLWELKWSERIAVLMVGFAAGGMLGAALFDLLPETTAEIGLLPSIFYTAVGLVVFWFIEHKLLAHHHKKGDHIHKHPEATAYLVLFGDTVHNFVDGVAIAATFLVSIPLGVVTGFAVFIHEIPQELGDVAILLRGGMSRIRIVVFNFLSALVAVLGAAMGLYALGSLQGLVQPLLGFTAGGFLYLAVFDLLPETYRQSGKYHSAPLAVILGFAVIVLLSFAIPA